MLASTATRSSFIYVCKTPYSGVETTVSLASPWSATKGGKPARPTRRDGARRQPLSISLVHPYSESSLERKTTVIDGRREGEVSLSTRLPETSSRYE